MAFDLTTYADPGVYTAEVVVPNGVNIPGLPFAVTLIGVGSRQKRITSEAVQRGLLKNEAVTFSGSPIAATLSKRAVRTRNTTTLRKTLSGITTTVSDNFVSFAAASISGAAGPYGALVANSADSFSLQLDGLPAVTITLVQDNAATPNPTVTVVGGTEFQVHFDFPTHALANATRANVAQCINAALGSTAASLLGYGANYGNTTGTTGVASGSGSVLKITSPLTGAASDVRVFSAITHNASNTIFGAVSVDAASVVLLNPLVFDVNATWSIDYVVATDVDTFLDPLANSQVQGIAQVGSFQNVGNFQPNLDWRQAGGSGTAANIVGGAAPGFMRVSGLTSMTQGSVGGLLTLSGAASFQNNGTFVIAADVNTTTVDVVNANAVTPDANNGSVVWSERRPAVDWSIEHAATFTTPVAGPYTTLNAGTIDNFLLSVDGKRLVQVTLVSPGVTPLGFSAGTTTALVAANINAILANDAAYGQRYNAVASAGGTGNAYLVLTSPTTGIASSIFIQGITANQQATTAALFGFSSSQSTVGQVVGMGTGQRPAQGAVYFATYDYTRPASEYGVPYRFFTKSDALDQVGQASAKVPNYNPLAQAVQLAFANGANVVYTIQVDDSTNPGSPTRTQIDACLDAAKKLEALTEVIVLEGTTVDVQVDQLAHVEQECAPTEKHFRRGWYGMASGTAVGDSDTPGTFVYAATQTLQVSPSSPGRGRSFLVAPPQKAGLSITFTLDDGTSVRRSVDSTYLAVACAALKTALPLASDTLMRRSITGFNVDDITNPWLKQERALLASNGVLVVTYDGGRLIMLDPVTTEAGGGNLIQFKQDSSSYQKDNVVRKVNLALDGNVVGIVPFDLQSFVTDIRLLIANVISAEIAAGNIGPYRDPDTGQIRPIDLLADIIVAQSKTDPTKFYFKYWFNLLYPAARLLGEYSVDNPFFSRTVAA